MISDKQNEFFYQFKKRRALRTINIIILISFFIFLDLNFLFT